VEANRLIDHDRAAPIGPGTALLLVTLLGAVLRLFFLDHQSLWLDEVSSLRNARAFGQGGLDALAAVDQIAPLHSVALWLSTSLGGTGAVAARMPSVLAGIATIPLVHLAALRMFGSRQAALFAALLTAISPFGIWYSQEGRMYALLMLATCAYVCVAWPIVARPLRLGELAALAAITLLGLGMHHYMALLSASFGLFLLVKDRGIRRASLAWAASQIAAALVFSYWMLLTAEKVGGAAGNEKPGFLLWVPYTVYTFVVGFSFGPTTADLAMAGSNAARAALAQAPAILLVAVPTAILGLRALRRLRRSNREAALWLAIWLVGPILLAVLSTLVTNISFNVRYVVTSFPALMILLGLALADLPWARWPALLRGARDGHVRIGMAAGAALLACMLVATVNIYANPAYARADMRALARFLKHPPGHPILVADNDRVSKMLAFYGTPGLPVPMQASYLTDRPRPPQVWQALARDLPASGREVWLIEYRSWETDPQRYLRAQLDRHGQLLGRHDWPGVAVRRYRVEGEVATAGRRGAPATREGTQGGQS
jgi:mannosyltransferase